MTAVELIKEIKQVSNLWDSDIANILSVSTHSVNMWLNGRTEPRSYYVAKLESMLTDLQSYENNVGHICCRIKAMEILNGTN